MISYSVEYLVHFKCAECGKWWSIGDYINPEEIEIMCPHCGHKAFPRMLGVDQ